MLGGRSRWGVANRVHEPVTAPVGDRRRSVPRLPRTGEVSEHRHASGVAPAGPRWLSALSRLPFAVVHPPATGTSWLALTDLVLPIAAVYEWCVQPECGAVVLFSGVVRDHAVDEHGNLRADVTHLLYEAYESQAAPAFAAIDAELRGRWPQTGRVALLHRIGVVSLMESSVVVAVSAPHRPEAFEAARFAIDAIKASAPIWKHETWAEGADWGTAAHALVTPDSVATVGTGGDRS